MVARPAPPGDFSKRPHWRGTLAGLALLLTIPWCGPAQALEFHVSPTGSDSNAGTAAAPFATPEKARAAVRAAVRDASPAVVWLHGGNYFRTAEFALGNLDNNCIYQAAPNETPRFIGGVTLDPAWFTPVTADSPVWSRLATAARGNLMEVDLAAHGITDYGSLLPRGFNMSNTGPMELLVNSKPQELARWPNAGSWATIASAPSSTTFTYSGTQPSRWSQAEEVWVHGNFYYNWADYAVKVTSINTATSTITVPATAYGIRSGTPYFAFNLLEEIDTAGEYYIKRDTGKLYYWPVSGFSSAEVIVTVMSAKLLSVSSASNITVEGIEFVGTRSRLAQVTSGANVVFQRCRFLATGTDAISISGTNSGINNCEIADAGSGGVSLSGGDRATLTPGGNYARQSLIHDLSRLSFTYNPGARLSGVGQLVEHCEIYGNRHAAIIFGGNEHHIEYNNIHDVCTTTDDAGAIYCGRDWGLRGNLLRFNFLHDIKSTLGGDVHAIYLDDCASGVTNFGNVIYRVAGRAMLNGGGRDNVWANNVVAKCTYFHFGDARGPANINNTPGNSWNLLEKIIAVNYQSPPWSTAYPALAAIPNNYTQLGPYKYPQGVVLSRNVSWQNTTYIYSSGSATSYYAEVANNLNGQDPLFVNEAALDLTLRADSAALAIPGFQPIPFKHIGRTVGTVTWDADAATTAAQDGGGTWRSGAGSNWWNGAPQVWDGGMLGHAYANFGGAAGSASYTVALGSAVALRGLTFANQRYTIGPDPGNLYALTLTDEAAITTAANGVISARIAGGAGLTKTGGSQLTLSGSNNYTGATTLAGGTLALSGGNNRLPATGTVNFSAAGTLDVGSTSQTLANLTSANGITGTVQGTGGTLSLGANNFTLGGTADNTTQTLNLSGLATFNYNKPAGSFSVVGQFLPTTGTHHADGVLTMAATTTITAASLNVGAPGSSSIATGAYQKGSVNLGQHNTINANTLNIGTGSKTWGVMQFNGTGLTGTPALILRNGAGTGRATMNVGSNGSGTNGFTTAVDLATGYPGGTSLDAMLGTLTLAFTNRGGSNGACGVTATFTMGGGTLDATSLIVAADLATQISPGATSGTFNLGVTGGAPGGTVKVTTLKLGDQLGTGTLTSIFNLNHGGTVAAQTIQPGAGTTTTRTFNWNDGTIKNYDAATDLTIGAGPGWNLAATGTHTFAIDAARSATVNAVLGGTGGTLVKAGPGTLALTAANTYSGTTTVAAGTLALGGALSSSSLANLATFAPQGAALTSGAFTQAATGTFRARLNGPTVGSGYDQLKTPGPVTLAGTLDLIAAPALAAGSNFTLIDNTGAAAVSCTFTNLPQAAEFYEDAQWWRISYSGGTGNDVVVTRITPTPWQSWQAANFGANTNNTALTAPLVDIERDGLVNLLEYALGGNPNAASPNALPQANTAGGYLALTFTRTPANTDITMTVRGSNSPAGPWTDLARSSAGAAFTPLLGGVTETGSGATRTVQVRDLYHLNDSAHPRRFLRLEVTRP
jgi:autotransporter-associated beta strand protein